MYFYVWPVIHIIIIITIIIIINALLFLYLFRKRHALHINIFDLNCVF